MIRKILESVFASPRRVVRNIAEAVGFMAQGFLIGYLSQRAREQNEQRSIVLLHRQLVGRLRDHTENLNDIASKYVRNDVSFPVDLRFLRWELTSEIADRVESHRSERRGR